jgi:hypothetical protein
LQVLQIIFIFHLRTIGAPVYHHWHMSKRSTKPVKRHRNQCAFTLLPATRQQLEALRKHDMRPSVSNTIEVLVAREFAKVFPNA